MTNDQEEIEALSQYFQTRKLEPLQVIKVCSLAISILSDVLVASESVKQDAE